jgi:DNA-directed RNA polymerase specialized sigma24 family protein
MRDNRREIVLTLIFEWDPLESKIHDHLGMTIDQWMAFRSNGDLPRDYEPREPKTPVELDEKRIGRSPALSPEQVAQALRLRADGLTHREVAIRMGCGVTTIKSAMRRALAK